MAKTISLTYNGKDYTLEFTRRTVREMEKKGFNITRVTDFPMTMIPELFRGAFLAHHRSTKKEVIDEILSNIRNREDLITTLAEMYNEPILALLTESEDEDNEKNVEWTVG